MNQEKLIAGNNLQHEIRERNQTIKEIQDCLKEIELNDFRSIFTSLNLDRKKCNLNTERLISYMNSELIIERNKLIQLECKFKEL